MSYIFRHFQKPYLWGKNKRVVRFVCVSCDLDTTFLNTLFVFSAYVFPSWIWVLICGLDGGRHRLAGQDRAKFVAQMIPT